MLDPSLPIFASFGVTPILRKFANALVDWLRFQQLGISISFTISITRELKTTQTLKE